VRPIPSVHILNVNTGSVGSSSRDTHLRGGGAASEFVPMPTHTARRKVKLDPPRRDVVGRLDGTLLAIRKVVADVLIRLVGDGTRDIVVRCGLLVEGLLVAVEGVCSVGGGVDGQRRQLCRRGLSRCHGPRYWGVVEGGYGQTRGRHTGGFSERTYTRRGDRAHVAGSAGSQFRSRFEIPKAGRPHLPISISSSPFLQAPLSVPLDQLEVMETQRSFACSLSSQCATLCRTGRPTGRTQGELVSPTVIPLPKRVSSCRCFSLLLPRSK
jgi:hypothetical protein